MGSRLYFAVSKVLICVLIVSGSILFNTNIY
eukprot:UN06278